MKEDRQCGGRESRQVIPKIVLAGDVASGHGTGTRGAGEKEVTR